MDLKKIGSIEAIALILIMTLNSLISDSAQDIIKNIGSASIINIVYCTIIALILFFIIFKLFEKFNKEDILDISEFFGGKVFKNIIGILFLLYFTFISSIILRNFAEILKVAYFPETSISTILLCFIIVIYIASTFRTSSIIKTNLLIIPFTILSIVLIFVATSGDFIYEHMFPILGYGFEHTFFNGASHIFAFSGLAYLYFFMPNISSSKKATKLGVISIVISSILLLLSIVSFLFGAPYVSYTEEISATLFIIRSVSFGRFFERPESLFILVWILSVISYLSVTIIVIGSILNKTIGSSNSITLRSFYTPIIFVCSLIPYNLSTVRFLQYNIFKYVSIIMVYIIPLIILILSFLKKRKLEKGVSSA